MCAHTNTRARAHTHIYTRASVRRFSSGSRIQDDSICSELILDAIHRACEPPVEMGEDRIGRALVDLLEHARTQDASAAAASPMTPADTSFRSLPGGADPDNGEVATEIPYQLMG